MGDVVNLNDYRKRLKGRVKNRVLKTADREHMVKPSPTSPEPVADKPQSGKASAGRSRRKASKTVGTTTRESTPDEPSDAG